MASVVIPVHNGAATIGLQLNALLAQDVATSWEIVIADNGSTDGTRSVVESHRITNRVPIRIVEASQVRGANHARNRGVEEARADVIVFCDCDDEVRPGWLAAHIDALSITRSAITAGPVVIDRINSLQAQRQSNGLVAPGIAGDVQFGWGANFGFHRSVWERCGRFDPDFLYGFDEIEFMVRAQRSGAQFVWLEDAIVDYRIPSSVWNVIRKYFRQGQMYPRITTLHPDVFTPLTLWGALMNVRRAGVRIVKSVLRARRHNAIATFAYHYGIFVGILGSRIRRRTRHKLLPRH